MTFTIGIAFVAGALATGYPSWDNGYVPRPIRVNEPWWGGGRGPLDAVPPVPMPEGWPASEGWPPERYDSDAVLDFLEEALQKAADKAERRRIVEGEEEGGP